MKRSYQVLTPSPPNYWSMTPTFDRGSEGMGRPFAIAAPRAILPLRGPRGCSTPAPKPECIHPPRCWWFVRETKSKLPRRRTPPYEPRSISIIVYCVARDIGFGE